MSDLFHDRVPVAFIEAVFRTMAETPHTYQVLTKRSERLARLAPLLPWPPNVWMGVSVEDQDHALRAIRLQSVPAHARFVSAEPLLGPLDLRRPYGLHRSGWHVPLRGIHWVIAGGESGLHARACDLDWLRSLRDQCRAAGVAFFLKQLGGHPDKRGHGAALLDGRLWREMPEAQP